MKKKLLALLMGTSLVLAACGGGTAKDKNEPAPAANKGGETTAGAGDAQKLYDQKCSSCHGGNLEGTVGPALNKIGSQLSKEDIENVIANGKGAMPKGLLQGDEASAVAEWLAAKK